VRSVYTSGKDKKVVAIIKRALISSLSKRFSRQAAQQLQTAFLQNEQAEPIHYTFNGEDTSGIFHAEHDLSLDEDGGLTLVETRHVKPSSGARRLDVKQRGGAKLNVDKKGRVTKVRERVESSVGSNKQSTSHPAAKLGDMGKIKFRMVFDVLRESEPEHIAECDAGGEDDYGDYNLEEFENMVHHRLEGAEERPLFKEYTDEDLDYDESEDVDPKTLVAHAVHMMDTDTVDIASMAKLMRPDTITNIYDAAYRRYQANMIDNETMKNILAAIGNSQSEPAYTALIDTMKGQGADPELRSQAMFAMLAPEQHVPSYVLDAVSDVAFSDPRDEDQDLKSEATLLLGSLCDGHPFAGPHVDRLHEELEKTDSSVTSERRHVLSEAISNANPEEDEGVDPVSDLSLEDDEASDLLQEAEVVAGEEEQDDDEDAVADVDMQGLSKGKYYLINKRKTLTGSSKGNFETWVHAKIGAEWDTTKAGAIATAGLNIKLFKWKWVLLGAEAKANAVKNTFSAGYNVKVLNKAIISKSVKKEPKYLKYGGACPSHIKSAPTVKQWKKSKTFIKVEKRFMLGPVPLKVSISVDGFMAVDLNMGAWLNCKRKNGEGDLAVMGGLHPNAGLSVSASAAVDAFVARAGVEGTLTIFKGGVPAYGHCTTSQICAKTDLELSALGGNVKIFAEIGFKVEDEAEMQSALQRSETIVNNALNANLEEGDSNLLGEHQRGWFRRAKSWVRRKARRAVRFVRRTYNRAKRFVRKAGAVIKRGAKAAWKGIKKGAKWVAKNLNKRWTKVLVKWAGRSKKINLWKRCKGVSIRKFFTGGDKKKKDEKKPAKKDAKKPTKKTTPKKPAKKGKTVKKYVSGPKRKTGGNAAKTARKQGRQTRQTARRGSQRANKQIRNQGRRTRATERREGRSAKRNVNNSAKKTRQTMRNRARQNRGVIRKSSRRVKAKAQQEEKNQRKMLRRQTKRMKKSSSRNRRVDRRLDGRILKRLQRIKNAGKSSKIRRMIRRQRHAEARRQRRVKRALRRRANRQRFQRLRKHANKEASSIKRMLRSNHKTNMIRRRFQRMRRQDRRRFTGLAKARRRRTVRRFIRRKANGRARSRRMFRRMRSRMSKGAARRRTRLRLRRMRRSIQRRTTNRRRMRRGTRSLVHRLRAIRLRARRRGRRNSHKLLARSRRNAARRRKRRMSRRWRVRIRRSTRRRRNARRAHSLRRRTRRRFRRGARGARRRAMRMRRQARMRSMRRRRRMRARRMRMMMRRRARRSRSRTRRRTRRTRRVVRRRGRRGRSRFRWGGIAKRLRQRARAARMRARRRRLRARARARRVRRTARRFAKRAMRRGRSIFKRLRRGARRGARRVGRHLRRGARAARGFFRRV